MACLWSVRWDAQHSRMTWPHHPWTLVWQKVLHPQEIAACWSLQAWAFCSHDWKESNFLVLYLVQKTNKSWNVGGCIHSLSNHQLDACSSRSLDSPKMWQAYTPACQIRPAWRYLPCDNLEGLSCKLPCHRDTSWLYQYLFAACCNWKSTADGFPVRDTQTKPMLQEESWVLICRESKHDS